MPKRIRHYKPQNNVALLNAIRKNASNEYQRRIPEATKANVREIFEDLWNWKPGFNEAIHALINRIGMEIYRAKTWENPLSAFKIGNLEFGDTIEEVMTGLLRAYEYDPGRDSMEQAIFSRDEPEVQVSYHKVSRMNYYKLTIDERLLRRAFNDDFGLSTFISNLMGMPETSDNYDEFLLMTKLFSLYEDEGGFFKVNVPDVSATGSTEADAKAALRAIRAMVGTLPTLSRHYNAAGMPTFARPEDLILVASPEFMAAVEVEALAGMFNISVADIPTRVVVIPDEFIGIDGFQAILTTKDFFVVADERLETTSAANPVGLFENYFLHHWQVISASRFVPAVMFWTGASTEIESVETPVASVPALVVTDWGDEVVTEVERGGKYRLSGNAVTDPEGGFNDAIIIEVEGASSPRTYVKNEGWLYVGVDEEAETLTITARAEDDETKTSATTVSVTGDILILWPDPRVEDSPVTPDPDPDPGTGED